MATNPAVANSNWQSLGAGTWYGGNVAIGGGGNAARDGLDAARMGVARVPSAEYPDGYLGTINSRRSDRLLDSLKQNNRSYTRGVHKGERVDPSDYIWPANMQPERGLVNEASGVKTAPLLELAPRPHLVNSGKAQPADAPQVVDPKRRAQLGSLMPTWS